MTVKMKRPAKAAPKPTAKDEPLKQLGARIPASLYKRLLHYTVDHGAKVKDALAEAVDEYLRNRGA